MTRERAIQLTFFGLAIFAVGQFGREWLETFFGPYGYNQTALDFVREGGLRTMGAVIAVAGAYFWVARRPA